MSMPAWQKILTVLSLAGFVIVAAALPFSNWLMSFGCFWLAGACALQWTTDVIEKKSLSPRIRQFTQSTAAWLITSVFLLALVGMLWTDDSAFGLKDVRMKLPMLVLPVSIFTMRPLNARHYRIVLGTFLLSVVFAAIVCLLIYWRFFNRVWTDVRDISVFISHIRFSLLIAVALIIAFCYTWPRGAIGKAFCVLYALPLLYLLYALESITGFAVLLVVLAFLLYKLLRKSESRIKKVSISVLLIVIPCLSVAWLAHRACTYFDVSPVSIYPKETALGGPYEHNLQYPLIEHGHYVMTHIAWSELYDAWQQRSIVHPDSMDARGNVLKGTLIRYAAARNLHKDHVGIMQLTNEDVRNIEAGFTSPDEMQTNAIARRIDRILFEYANFKAGGDANGHSVFQRLEFWRASWRIITKNIWTGVGTGDTKQAFAKEYELMQSTLTMENRLRGHNQYLTHWLTYGIVGVLLLLAVLIWPLLRSKNTLLSAFIIIAALSFLTEDTLETQAGVMFFSFFYCLLHINEIEENLPPS
ncbi:MAG: O-antigen ligase family protein [Flavobacteriales bacterium]